MWIFRNAADESDQRPVCRRERPITLPHGAKRLRDELQKVRATNPGSERVAELEQILASIHVVDPTDAPANSVTFGATMKVQDKKGATETFTIVGVDELDFEQDAVSWISSLAKRC